MKLDASAKLVAPALVTAVIAISFAAIFFRQAAPMHPVYAAGLRLFIASLLLLPIAVATRKGRRLDSRTVKGGVLAGFAYALHFGTWVTSLTLTTVAASVTLVTATPLLLAIVALVTGRDKPDRWLWFALACAGFGLAIVGWHDASMATDALLGDALALTGAAGMALYMLTVRRLGQDLDIWVFSTIATAVGATILLGGGLVAGLPIDFGARELLFVALAALIPQMVGHNLVTWVLRHTTPTVVGIAVLGEPVGAAILGLVILDEAIPLPVAAGCAITLVGVSLAVISRRGTTPTSEARRP